MSDSLGALKLTCSHPSTGDLAAEGKWLEQWGEMSNEGTHFPAPFLLCQPPPAWPWPPRPGVSHVTQNSRSPLVIQLKKK